MEWNGQRNMRVMLVLDNAALLLKGTLTLRCDFLQPEMHRVRTASEESRSDYARNDSWILLQPRQPRCSTSMWFYTSELYNFFS